MTEYNHQHITHRANIHIQPALNMDSHKQEEFKSSAWQFICSSAAWLDPDRRKVQQLIFGFCVKSVGRSKLLKQQGEVYAPSLMPQTDCFNSTGICRKTSGCRLSFWRPSLLNLPGTGLKKKSKTSFQTLMSLTQIRPKRCFH